MVYLLWPRKMEGLWTFLRYTHYLLFTKFNFFLTFRFIKFIVSRKFQSFYSIHLLYNAQHHFPSNNYLIKSAATFLSYLFLYLFLTKTLFWSLIDVHFLNLVSHSSKLSQFGPSHFIFNLIPHQSKHSQFSPSQIFILNLITHISKYGIEN